MLMYLTWPLCFYCGKYCPLCRVKIGNPTNEHKKDPEGKPEKVVSKIAKQGTILATKVTKLVIKNSGLDEDTVDVLEGTADVVENQADAGRDATLTDRLKMATGDTAGIIADNVDNPYVSVSACRHFLYFYSVDR